MKVKDLLELNQCITDVCIEVRRDGNQLEDALHIGPDYGVKPPYPLTVGPGTKRQKETQYIVRSINKKDDGAEYFQICCSTIPESWLSLEVFSWESRSVWSRHHRYYHPSMQGITITALPNGNVLEVKEKVQKPKEDIQLEGQTNIFDFI